MDLYDKIIASLQRNVSSLDVIKGGKQKGSQTVSMFS